MFERLELDGRALQRVDRDRPRLEGALFEQQGKVDAVDARFRVGLGQVDREDLSRQRVVLHDDLNRIDLALLGLFGIEFEGDAVRDLDFSPGGKRLVSAGDDATVLLWDLASRRIEARWTLPESCNATSTAVAPDGALIAVGDDYGAVRFWNARTHRLHAELRGLHAGEVGDLAFSPDGDTVAVAGQDWTISLIDVATCRPSITLTGHGAGVNRAVFAPSGEILATSGHDHSIRCWRGRRVPSINPDLDWANRPSESIKKAGAELRTNSAPAQETNS